VLCAGAATRSCAGRPWQPFACSACWHGGRPPSHLSSRPGAPTVWRSGARRSAWRHWHAEIAGRGAGTAWVRRAKLQLRGQRRCSIGGRCRKPGPRLVSRWGRWCALDVDRPHGLTDASPLAPVANLCADAFALHPSGHHAAAPAAAAATVVAAAVRDCQQNCRLAASMRIQHHAARTRVPHAASSGASVGAPAANRTLIVKVVVGKSLGVSVLTNVSCTSVVQQPTLTCESEYFVQPESRTSLLLCDVYSIALQLRQSLRFSHNTRDTSRGAYACDLPKLEI